MSRTKERAGWCAPSKLVFTKKSLCVPNFRVAEQKNEEHSSSVAKKKIWFTAWRGSALQSTAQTMVLNEGYRQEQRGQCLLRLSRKLGMAVVVIVSNPVSSVLRRCRREDRRGIFRCLVFVRFGFSQAPLNSYRRLTDSSFYSERFSVCACSCPSNPWIYVRCK